MPHLSSEFTDHYRAHFDFTWRNLRRLGVPSTELDDAAQEVFVVLLRRRASIHPELPIRAWLFGVIRRIAWRYRRSDTRRRLLRDAVDQARLEPETRTSVDDRPDQLHDAREAARLVERFLAELTPIQAEVFVLAELEQLSGKEIAEHLGVNQNTVWSRLRLARRAFDRRFAPIRAESTRLYQRNSTGRRHPVLSLSRRGHRPSTGDRRRVGVLLGIPGFGAAPASTAPPVTALSPLEVTAKTSTGAPLAGMVGAALTAALTIGVGLSARSETTAEDRTGIPPAAGVVGASPGVAELATPVELTSTKPGEPSHLPTPAPQSPLPSPPKARPRSAPKPDSDAPQPEPVAGGQAAPRESALGAEYKLIAAARRAFTADPTQSLALSETHRRDYPNGILAKERDGLRIAALCQLDRGPEARRLANKLAPRLDDPRTIRRFLAGCEPPEQ